MVKMLTAAYGVHDKNQTIKIENAILANFISISAYIFKKKNAQ